MIFVKTRICINIRSRAIAEIVECAINTSLSEMEIYVQRERERERERERRRIVSGSLILRWKFDSVREFEQSASGSVLPK